MKKVILEFDLCDDAEAFEDALKGSFYKSVIEELYNYIRNELKYTDHEYISYEALREKLNEFMKE